MRKEWSVEKQFQQAKSLDLLREDIQDKSEVMLDQSILEMTILMFLKDTEEVNQINEKLRGDQLVHNCVCDIIQVGMLYTIITAIFFQ